MVREKSSLMEEGGGPFTLQIRPPSSPDTKSKKPNRRFAILKKSTRLDENGRRPAAMLSMPEVDTINRLFREGALSYEDAYKQMRDLRDRLYQERDKKKPSTRLFHQINANIFERFWEDEYAHRRIDTIQKENRKTAYIKTINAIGALPVTTAKIGELQTALDKTFPKASVQRRYAICLNGLLRYVSRRERIQLAQEEYFDIQHLTIDEFKAVLPFIRDKTLSLLATVAFATGCRAGECFTLTSRSLKAYDKGAAVTVTTQLKRNMSVGKTKNRKERTAMVIPDFVSDVKAWIDLDRSEKEAIRLSRLADLIRSACRKAFPKAPEKHIKFHDLRHSYVIHLINIAGLQIEYAARCIGDSVATTAKHYAGYILRDETMARIIDTYNSSQK